MSDSNSANTSSLQGNTLGLLGAVSLTAAYMAPAAAVIALFGPVVLNAESKGAFVMLLGLLVTLPSAVSFGMLAKELPSAGGVAMWSRRTLGIHAGRWVGLTTVMYYLVLMVFPPIVFGQLFNNMLFDLFAIQGGMGTWMFGAILSLIITAVATYRGIAASSWLAFAMLMLQFVIMTALALTFVGLSVKEHTFAVTPFLPPTTTVAWSGVFLALPLAMLSLVCDGATPVSEETKNAKRTIPLAIFLALILVGTWDVLAFAAFSLSAPIDELLIIVTQDISNPIPRLAESVWGPYKILITFVGMIAMIGGLVPVSTAASRVIYALGRDGTLPQSLGGVHQKYRTPWRALHLVFIFTVLGFAPLSLYVGASRTIDWWGSVVVWLIIAVYFATNLCNIIFYWRYRRTQFSLLWNFITPLLAMIIQLYIIWQVVIIELWQAGWLGRSAQVFIVISSCLLATYVVFIRDQHTVSTETAEAAQA